VLGAIGDERAVQELIRFLEESGPARLTAAGWAARSSVPVALGWALHRSGDRRALAWLSARVQPQGWEASALRWLPPGEADARARDVKLSRRAVMGLGLSGRPAGREVLQRTLEAAPGPDRELLQEAIQASEVVERDGLEGYYRRGGHR